MANIIGGSIGSIKLLRMYVGSVLYRNFGISIPALPAVGMTGTMREYESAMGVAVKDDLFTTNTTYADILKSSFERYTPENAGKFGRIQGTEGTFNFGDLDALLDLCLANNKQMHLHALVWAQYMPSWITDNEGLWTEAQTLAKLTTHINTVLDHVMQSKWAGIVVSTDVANEPFADNGAYKNSALYRMAPNYIRHCVKCVTDRYPKILTFVNDYGQEYGSSAKTNALIDLKDECAAYGGRLDGIGLQLHTVLRMDANLLQTRFNLIANAGLMVHVSELDMTLNQGTDNTNQGPYPFLTPALDAAAADKYAQIMDAYLTVPANLQFGFTTWSVGDYDNYINSTSNGGVQDYPGLRYLDFTPKPALLKLISKAYKIRTPLVYDNFRLNTRADINGTTTNGGQIFKTWTVAGSGTGYGTMAVTAKGLQCVTAGNGSFGFALVDVGVSSYTMVFGLSDLLSGSAASANKNVVGVFRYLNATNFIFFRPVNSSTTTYWTLRKKVADVDTVLINDTVAANVNDVAAIVIAGNVITCYVNGRLVGSVTDTAFNTQTKAGFKFRGTTDLTSAVDFVAIGT